MGGPGSGGRRDGSGRKGKTLRQKILDGTATNDEREQALELEPIVPVKRPFDLDGPAAAVWDELAPLAQAERTLTTSTTSAFRHLCEAVAMRAEMAKTIAIDGLTIDTPLGLKAHPLFTQYRGLAQRIETGMVRFRLSPIGKQLLPELPKEERDDDFDLDVDDQDEDDDQAVS